MGSYNWPWDAARLDAFLRHESTTHEARLHLSHLLGALGDLRPGLDQVAWCPVDVPNTPVTFRNERSEIYGTFALRPYAIAKYPITFAQFQAFIDAPDGFANPAWWADLPEAYRQQPILAPRIDVLPTQPRHTVSWVQAMAYARWLDVQMRGQALDGLTVGENAVIRLPTEWEWQWAAQGDVSDAAREYPWGAWDARRANTREARVGESLVVGLYPHGESWCGAQEMSGGVWEWCANGYHTPADLSTEGMHPRVLRGGSFVDIHDWASCAARFNDLPNRRLDYFGFRVVCAGLA